MPLKSFLKIRDTNEAYAGVRERHSVGIPCIDVEGEVTIVRDVEHMKELYEQYNLGEE